MGAKLGNYNEITWLQTSLARLENYTKYFEWDDSDKLFPLRARLVGTAGEILWDAGKQSRVSQIVALLKARFGTENQAERIRAELRSGKRNKVGSLQKLYKDVCRLMSLAYSGESSALSDIIGCDAFLDALDDRALPVRILEKEPKHLDDALSLVCRLEAFDIVDSTTREGDMQIKIRTCRRWRQVIRRLW